jgi:hypothetical protein
VDNTSEAFVARAEKHIERARIPIAEKHFSFLIIAQLRPAQTTRVLHRNFTVFYRNI